MEKIQNGKYVELGYDLYEVAADGSQKLVHQTDIEDPEKFVYGVTEGMIEPLERAVEGLEVGGTFDIIVKCDDAFGPHDPDQVAELDRDIFVVDGKFDDKKIKPGAIVPMMTADGYRINGLVTAVSLTHVTMDFNHPLAGKDVRFAGKILVVRDATPEDLAPMHSCGCGCHGDCGDGCGDDCGCDCDGSHHNHCGCGDCH